MKKIITWAVCMLATFPCFAQWDIKVFDKIGKDAIIQMLGVPEPEEKNVDVMDGWICVDYYSSEVFPKTCFMLEEETMELQGFNTESPRFCVLSDYIPGGIKVGDSFSKLENFDFVHTAYGKNREGNALKFLESSPKRDYYQVYGAERIIFYFSVKNGIIIAIDMDELDEDTAIYYNCDMDNHPW